MPYELMRDSYKRFFKKFNINVNDLVEFGLNDTIYPEPDNIDDKWEDLKTRINNNGEVYIRGYGRDAKGTDLYFKLYELLLDNYNIKKDPTNNAKPRQLLERVTNYSKTKSSNGVYKISNYQVSHIFGRTKNPFMFTSPWNIMWCPKILDPFTGHESKGDYKQHYYKIFLKHVSMKYYKYIIEYNRIAESYLIKLDNVFEKMSEFIDSMNVDHQKFSKFKDDAKKEFSIIPVDEVIKDIQVVNEYLTNGKSHRWIQENILKIKAPSRGGGFESMKILHNYNIKDDKKGVLQKQNIFQEINKAKGKYREVLLCLQTYNTQTGGFNS